MSLQALLGVVRHLVIERIGVDVNILLISQVALPCGDAETASGGTQQHQNASSEASSRYSHSIRKGGEITQPPHDIHFRRNRIPYESLPPQQVERTVHLDDQSRQFDTQATIERRAGRRKPLQRRRRTPMNRMARLFSRHTRSGSSIANATNRHTCDRGRIPQPNRIRL